MSDKNRDLNSDISKSNQNENKNYAKYTFDSLFHFFIILIYYWVCIFSFETSYNDNMSAISLNYIQYIENLSVFIFCDKTHAVFPNCS